MVAALLRQWGVLAPLVAIMSLSACVDYGDHGRNAQQPDNPVPAPSVGTPDTVAPRIVATVPPQGARGAVLSGPVVVATFSETLAPATVNVNSFTLTGPAGRVDGDVSLQGAQASFTPRQPLAVGGDYTASLSVAIRDPAGNPLAAAHEWRFNTGGNRLAAGGRHTCLRADTGTIKCWGDNAYGQLGLGDVFPRGDAAGEMGDNLPPVALGGPAVDVVAGDYHSCARLENGSVKCWGLNRVGELGIGTDETQGDAPGEMQNLPVVNLGSGRRAAQVVAGSGHSCARLDNGAVKCWGNNSFGQLGVGDIIHRGRLTTDLGDRLPAVDLGTGRVAVELVAGGFRTCARLDNGAVKCWGQNDKGQLGIGDTLNRGDQKNEMGDRLPAVNLGTGRTAVQLVAGHDHSCARLDDGQLKCWGLNSSAQLGVGAADRGDETGEMGDALPAVNLGSNRHALGAAAGLQHSCAILDDGMVKCWGANSAGQLGTGNNVSIGFDSGVALPGGLGTGRSARDLVTGWNFSCAYLDNATVKCWGLNDLGQLGIGNTDNWGDAPSELGDNLGAVDLGTM